MPEPSRTDTLFLTMRHCYFDACKSGEKDHEYRLYGNYWLSRLTNPNLKRIEMGRGRGKLKGDASNLIFRWSGYTIEYLTHPHFGNEMVRVFSIPLVGERL